MEVRKNAVTIRVSREMALDMGMIEPTPEERVQRSADLEAFREKMAAANAALPYVVAALDRISDPLARRVLDLHQRSVSFGEWVCEGCEPGAYAESTPDWPCATTETVAEHYGIILPDYINRPQDGSLDAR